MISPQQFYTACKQQGIKFFTGVPDSLLKDFCAFLTDNESNKSHIIAVNEGCAIGLSTGHYLATGHPALVYMQNSGQGNAINPLLSLADPEVYGIPMFLVVGWRGEPGVHDEPQHIKQGRVMKGIFDAMEIPNEILEDNCVKMNMQVLKLIKRSQEESRPVAVIVKSGLFEKYDLQNMRKSPYPLSREGVIATVVGNIPQNAIIVATTGHISRELDQFRANNGQDHCRDFLPVGSMGHACQIA